MTILGKQRKHKDYNALRHQIKLQTIIVTILFIPFYIYYLIFAFTKIPLILVTWQLKVISLRTFIFSIEVALAAFFTTTLLPFSIIDFYFRQKVDIRDFIMGSLQEDKKLKDKYFSEIEGVHKILADLCQELKIETPAVIIKKSITYPIVIKHKKKAFLILPLSLLLNLKYHLLKIMDVEKVLLHECIHLKHRDEIAYFWYVSIFLNNYKKYVWIAYISFAIPLLILLNPIVLVATAVFWFLLLPTESWDQIEKITHEEASSELQDVFQKQVNMKVAISSI